MGSDFSGIRDQDSELEECWPQIGSYMENGILVRVFRPGWAEGVAVDHVVKTPKKGRKGK